MLYNPWSASRCIVLYLQTITFLMFLLISCSTFRITYGFSVALLLKGFHLHAIYKGTRSMLRGFFCFTIFGLCMTIFLATIITTLAVCSFNYTETKTNTIQNENVVASMANAVGSGFLVGVALSLVGFQFLDAFFQSLYLEELNYQNSVSGAVITLERVGRIATPINLSRFKSTDRAGLTLVLACSKDSR
uniref:Uncharacterized protein n=1 Tax=Tetranychus urticae TaxID=32264 RepID=A0A158P5F8_TETUR